MFYYCSKKESRGNMGFLIFILLVLIIINFYCFFDYKQQLDEVLTDLSYDVELLKIALDDYKYKFNKTVNIKNR